MGVSRRRFLIWLAGVLLLPSSCLKQAVMYDAGKTAPAPGTVFRPDRILSLKAGVVLRPGRWAG